MDIEIIEKIVQRVERSQVHQVTVADGAQSITVVNHLSGQSVTSSQGNTADQADNLPNIDAQKKEDAKASIVSSTYVGHVQLSPDGGPELLVNLGDSVEVGQTIAYVDVLSKLLPVESQIAGMVDEILVETGDAVEYGQPLLKLQ